MLGIYAMFLEKIGILKTASSFSFVDKMVSKAEHSVSFKINASVQ